ncbi:MAG TPA: ImmA/IrrE family metallo-endopeptidase [Verrucomicrobiae bacterium]|nr:ImmA/IrrE family metallo-endopeptidase [Verrucomicrobiae bacterium]
MRKVMLKPATRRDVDIQVEKILKGLGNPEPPLDLNAVFTLLQLDPQYYRTSEDGVVRETISRVKVGAKLIFERPTRIWDAIKAADLKALWIPDQKRILIDGDLHEMKKRWNGAHEIGHSMLDWHRDFTFGDDQLTLTEGCHIELEAEANYAAGRLLFLQSRFDQYVKGMRHTLKSLSRISMDFGNSWTSTLYRAVETLDVPSFAVIGGHPRRRTAEEKTRHFVTSTPFDAMFPKFGEAEALAIVRSYCSFSTRGPLGESTFALEDLEGECWEFTVESFALPQGDVLTLALLLKKLPRQVVVPEGLKAVSLS